MDDVERMYRHLVRTIRASFPQYLSQPFEVGELYQTILPYRLHRRDLGLETNQDYELALLELLSGAHGYLVLDDKMRDVLSAEHASKNPDTARIRDFGESHVALAPEALQGLDTGSHSAAAAEAPTASSRAPATPGAMRAAAAVPTSRPVTVPDLGENCPFCRGALPPGRKISFCPHCGQDLTVVHCPACGSELERGWKFCVTCGRGAAVS